MLHLICPNPALDRTILIDGYQEGQVNRPYLVHENAGGKSFNVAYVLKREGGGLCQDFLIHTILGGHMGDYLLFLNKKDGVPLAVTQVEKNTRTCTITIDSKERKTYLVYEKGFELDSDLLENFRKEILSSLQVGDYLVFSGSLMKGMPDDFIASLAEEVAGQVHLVVDTSGPALKEAVKAKPVLLKINDEEAAELVGHALEREEDLIQVLRDYADIPNFIITRGGDGVLARLGQDFYKLRFPAIQVKNPIASGDFFLGYLVHILEKEGQLNLQAVKKACAYASANCLEWLPQVQEDKIQFFLENIQVEEGGRDGLFFKK